MMTSGRNNQTVDATRSGRLWRLLLCLVPCAAASPAAGQVVIDAAAPAPARVLVRAAGPGQLVVQAAAPARVVVQAAAQVQVDAVEEEAMIIDAGFEIAETNFDQWIFGAQYADHGVRRIDSLLTLKVKAVHQACELTEAQQVKLELAGQGDIKRFYDDVEAARAKFLKVRRNRNAFNNVWQDIQPLQARVNAGLFNQDSFLQKVVKRTLTDEQAARYEEAEANRRQFRYHAKLALVVAMMERTMPLRAVQREQLIRVLMEETKPPHSFGQYDYYLVLYQLTKLPPERLQPLFDEAQWKVFQKFAAQGRGMEAFLKQQKALP